MTLERTVRPEKQPQCFSTSNTPAIDGVVTHELRHGGEARRVGTRAASLQLVTDLTVWSEMLSEDISRVTILAHTQGHESSCNDSTRICIILLTTQVAGQILRLHHDPQSPHPLENPQ